MPTSTQQQIIDEAVELIAAVAPLVTTVARRDRDLASQLQRALSSVALNLAEAFGTARGNSRLRFETARGSLCEAQAGLRVAAAWGYFELQQCTAPLQRMDALAGRIYGLIRR